MRVNVYIEYRGCWGTVFRSTASPSREALSPTEWHKRYPIIANENLPKAPARGGPSPAEITARTGLGIILRLLGEVRPLWFFDYEKLYGITLESVSIESVPDLALQNSSKEKVFAKSPLGGTPRKKSFSGYALRETEDTLTPTSPINQVWWPLFADSLEVERFILESILPDRLKSEDFRGFNRSSVHARAVELEETDKMFSKEVLEKIKEHIRNNSRSELLAPLNSEKIGNFSNSHAVFYATYKMLKILSDRGIKRSSGNKASSLPGIDAPSLTGGNSLQSISSPKASGGLPKFRGTPAEIRKQSGRLRISINTNRATELISGIRQSPVTRFSVGKKGIAWVYDVVAES